LRARLIVLFALVSIAALAAAAMMVLLFRQSTAAQLGQAQAEVERGCEAIENAYRFFSADWRGPLSEADQSSLPGQLVSVVQTALRKRPGVEGGIWRDGAQSLAYAFPTYQGSGPKTDLPAAEASRIQQINRTALAESRLVTSRVDATSQALVFAACPLNGPVGGLTAWTLTRVYAFGGGRYWLLVAGLGVLFLSVALAAMLLSRLMVVWSRQIGRIETALQAYRVGQLPELPETGERELDRIVIALNDAGQRLEQARQESERLARQVAASERLASIGRISAGVAHEIRNPIAAMRLKAENALLGDARRRGTALAAIVGQIDRLDLLLRRLLGATEHPALRLAPVALPRFLQDCASAHEETAAAEGVALRTKTDCEEAVFDADQVRSALDNLVLNAIRAAPYGTEVMLGARRIGDELRLFVHDKGPGPPPEVADRLFEPFVTGRTDGVGLGLPLVQEVARAHSGRALFRRDPSGTTFAILLPWPRS
jgi:signal transduction histidine kinase